VPPSREVIVHFLTYKNIPMNMLVKKNIIVLTNAW